MTRGRRPLALASLVLLMVASCAADDTELPFPKLPASSTEKPRPPLPNEIVPGLQLLPGEDGQLPVRVRWVMPGKVTEAIAVDGVFVYRADIDFTSFRLVDGSVAWTFKPEYTSPISLKASGGVQIGLHDETELGVLAPGEYDLRVDRATGKLRSLKNQREVPASFVPFPSPSPSAFRIESDLDETIAYGPDGAVAWRLVQQNPFVDEQPPIQADGAIVISTSGPNLLVLEPVPPANDL